MRSMTGYGRGQSSANGTQFSVEVNSVNRKQSDVTVTLPRELAELEPRVRDLINSEISRGRLNVVVAYHTCTTSQKVAIDFDLAKSYYKTMCQLKQKLGATGEVNIETVLHAPGVMRVPEEPISATDAWPHIEEALKEAMVALVAMREIEGKNLAKDLIKHLKIVREALRKVSELHPTVLKKFRQSLKERIEKVGLELPIDDERIVKEVIFFADKSDITEELTRLESHFKQFAHHLRRNEPVGRTLEFMTQEICRELNTLGSKANDVEISQSVVMCKAEMEKIREQIQNIE